MGVETALASAAFATQFITTNAAAIGTVTAVEGTAASAYGAHAQSVASQKAETARKNQMEFESIRRQRDIMRKNLISRSAALTNATAQGATEGSALPGAYSQINAQTGAEQAATNQNTEIGRDIFAANADMASAQSISAIGRSVTGFGTTLINNAEGIERLGAQKAKWLGGA